MAAKANRTASFIRRIVTTSSSEVKVVAKDSGMTTVGIQWLHHRPPHKDTAQQAGDSSALCYPLGHRRIPGNSLVAEMMAKFGMEILEASLTVQNNTRYAPQNR